MKSALQIGLVALLTTVGFGQTSGGGQQAVISSGLVIPVVAQVNPAPALNAGIASPLVTPAPNAVALPTSATVPLKTADLHAEKRVWYGLMAGEHSAAFFDAWSTRQVLATGGHELDPLVRPFAHSDAIYPALQVSPLLADYFALRLMHSNNRFLNKLWWMPQVVGTAGSSFCAMRNFSNIR